jgi:hypothetical protein
LSREGKVGPLLRSARITMRLSLRKASGTSRMIADILGDDRYFISPSSLCDYELLNTAPRHFQTVITLCSLYGLVTADLLKAIGIGPEEAGSEPMPDHFVSRFLHVESAEKPDRELEGGGTLGAALVLQRSLSSPIGLRHFYIREGSYSFERPNRRGRRSRLILALAGYCPPPIFQAST